MNRFSHSILSTKTIVMMVLFATLSFSVQAQDIGKAGGSGSNKVKVDVYPNPTSEELTIDLSKLNLDQPKIEVRSIIGSKMGIYLEKIGPKKYKVNVSSFPRGYYLVLVREDRSKFQQTVRFSKK